MTRVRPKNRNKQAKHFGQVKSRLFEVTKREVQCNETCQSERREKEGKRRKDGERQKRDKKMGRGKGKDGAELEGKLTSKTSPTSA